MKGYKVWLKRIAIILLSIIILYAIGRTIDVLYGSYQFVERAPYQQLPTTTSMRIRWQSRASSIGCIELNTTQRVCEKEKTDTHSIDVTNLTPDTAYSFAVFEDGNRYDELNRSIRTLSSISKPIRMWVIGDSGQWGPRQIAVRDAAYSYFEPYPDLWLLLGDNAYGSGTQKQYNLGLFTPYASLIQTLPPIAANGNHDDRRFAFSMIFDEPTEAQSGGIASHNPEFYAIDHSDLHLIVLDSQRGHLTNDSDMAQWLLKDLQANQKKWVIVAFHHPPYSDGGHKSDHSFDSHARMRDIRENLLPIFERYGVDLVLSGHSHGYERSKLIHGHYGTSQTFDASKHVIDNAAHYYHKHDKGTLYCVMGSSSKLDHGSYKHPAMPVSFEMMGSLLLDINQSALKAQFITEKGTIQDFFRIDKE